MITYSDITTSLSAYPLSVGIQSTNGMQSKGLHLGKFVKKPIEMSIVLRVIYYIFARFRHDCFLNITRDIH